MDTVRIALLNRVVRYLCPRSRAEIENGKYGRREEGRELGTRECGTEKRDLTLEAPRELFFNPSKSSVIISASGVGCGQARRSVDPGLGEVKPSGDRIDC